jgi:hypothetical protein
MDKSYPLGAFVIAFKSAIRSLQLPYHKTFKFAVSHREAGFALKGLLTSSPLPSVACMYQSVLLELHVFGFCYFRFCCCVPPSAHASLAWLVISGCIRIEGSVASSLIGFFGRLHVSVDTARVLHFLDSLFSLALWRFYMCPSLAQLAISGCIHIEGSVASSLLGFSVACMSKLRTQLTRLTRLTQLSLLTLAYTADTGHMVYTVVRPHTAYTHSAYTAD